jgi:hypothetical protein
MDMLLRRDLMKLWPRLMLFTVRPEMPTAISLRAGRA